MMASSTMNRSNFAAIPLVLLLAACGGEKTAPPVEYAAAEPAGETSKIPIRGVVTASGNQVALRECGAPSASTMTLADAGGEVDKALASLSAKPSDGIFVELDGTSSADGRHFAVASLVSARRLGDSLACEQPVFEGEFQAAGNEPSWAIEIRENGIVYSSPSVPKGRTYPYAFTRTETGSVVYATKIDKPAVSTLEISLEPARCIDSMSGEWRGFKAHVTLDGRKIEGCASAGVPHGEFGNAPLDELNRFAGTYPRAVHLWGDPAIQKRLDALLGTAMPAFLENLKVQSALMKDGGIFYVTGNKPHEGGSDAAVFLADPTSDTIGVILFVKGVRRDFKEGGRDVALPAEVVTAIANMQHH
jgi:uncharacterized membrane protein